MKLEAVTVCVGYGDFLAETLPRNLPLFDHYTVVTSPDDKETQELCRRWSVSYSCTDAFYRGGDKFNKARGINHGLANLRYNEWICHLDADTWLPPLTRWWLEHRPMDKEAIYGVDRVEAVGFDTWRDFIELPHPGHDYNCRILTPGWGNFSLLDRIAPKEHGGYVPIGFTQIWYGATMRRYPVVQGDAEHSDVAHAIQWAPDKRHLIPEVIGVHLQSEKAPLGANWKGRTTARFGPAPTEIDATPTYTASK